MFRTPGGSSASSFLAGLLLVSLPTRVLFRNYAANGRGRGSADAAPFDAHLGTRARGRCNQFSLSSMIYVLTARVALPMDAVLKLIKVAVGAASNCWRVPLIFSRLVNEHESISLLVLKNRLVL